jgi:hypothetical protein
MRRTTAQRRLAFREDGAVRPTRLLAPVLCVLLAASACSGDDDSASSSTTTSTAEAPSTTTTSNGPLQVGEPLDMGDGTFVGVHPTEPIAYVMIVDHETDEVGCEGGEPSRLWAEPIGSGAAVPALADSFVSGDVLIGGSGGRIAVVDQCEGFLSALAVATPATDGTFDGYAEVDTAGAETDGQLLPSTIRWSTDGETLLGLVHPNEAIERSIAVRISLDGTVQQLVEADGLLAVADLSDGTIVTATTSSVTIGTAAPVPIAVSSISPAPDGRSIAVFGADGVQVLQASGAPVIVDESVASSGSWSADGSLLSYLRVTGDDAAVWLTPLDGSPVLVAAKGGFAAPRFTADGDYVLYNEAVDSGRGFDEPGARARKLT